jgi:RNA polymerase sigma-70 factor, ECF subfamily
MSTWSTSPSRVALRFWHGLEFKCRFALAASSDRDAAASKRARDAVTDRDAEDIQRARDGDGLAFERLVRRYQQEIARRVLRFSRDPLVVEELVQETFVEAYFSLHRYRSDAPLIHWLHRIAVRAGFRYWKSQRSRPINIPVQEQPLYATATQDRDYEFLDRVMTRLSPRDRLVLTLMYLEDRSVQETATLTGWSQTMVKVQAHRARGRLRKLMQQDRAGDQS